MSRSYVGPFYYARHDRAVTPFDKATLVRNLMDGAPQELAGQRVVQISDRDGVKYILADGSWLLIRPSGTEPVLRIYAEARSESAVQTLLEEGGALAETLLKTLTR
jgi:phosphomannomutase